MTEISNAVPDSPMINWGKADLDRYKMFAILVYYGEFYLVKRVKSCK